MFFRHVYEKGLAQASYIIGCQATKQAIVIDPKRDIDTYLTIAEQEHLNITHITETHIHADFLSGTRELAEATGAEILLSDEGGPDWQYQFNHTKLKNGDNIKVGNLILEVIHTPGHTPEHISFLLTDTPTADKPVMIFTGDFVFVGDVGRPDLLEKAAGITGTQEKGARDMFNSLKKFKQLDDYIQVWPGHGAGSACGKALGAVPGSTVGYEKLTNWALNISNEDEFVKTLLDGQPEPPKYFAMMKRLNKIGPEILGEIPQPKLLTQQQFEDIIKNGVKIVDTRDKISFAGGHLPNSINIQDNSSFSTWAGWLLDYDKPFILITRDDRIEHLTKALIRIGLDNIAGFMNDISDLSDAGYELKTLEQITAIDLNSNIENCFVLDVRGYSEFNSAHIPGSVNIHVGHLTENLNMLPDDSRIVVHCTSGDRSSIAASILLSNGYNNVSNLTCGINGWIKAKLPVEKSELVLT